MPKIWKFFFCCSTAFADEIIRGNEIYNSFYQLLVNMGKYLPKRENVHENNECRKAVRHSLFSQTFLLFGKYFPILTITTVVIFADLSPFRQLLPHINHYGTRYFRRPFPFSANISHINHYGPRYFRRPFPFSANISPY